MGPASTFGGAVACVPLPNASPELVPAGILGQQDRGPCERSSHLDGEPQRRGGRQLQALVGGARGSVGLGLLRDHPAVHLRA